MTLLVGENGTGKSIADMARRYGADPDAALSPQSQLAFLSMVKDAVDAGSQFLIATHAPILMAIPGAAEGRHRCAGRIGAVTIRDPSGRAACAPRRPARSL